VPSPLWVAPSTTAAGVVVPVLPEPAEPLLPEAGAAVVVSLPPPPHAAMAMRLTMHARRRSAGPKWVMVEESR
jgi:hypothetical protein